MRKITIFLFGIILFICTMLCGCGDMVSVYSEKLADYRTDLLVYNDENFEVTVVTGSREENFAFDGECGDKIDYTVVTILPLVQLDDYTIKMNINGIEYMSPLNKHPLGETYSVEINEKLSQSSVNIEVSGITFVAKSVIGEDYILANDALEVACTMLDLENASEIHIRLIENPIISDGKYYYYVACYNNGSSNAVLIDAITGVVLAEK